MTIEQAMNLAIKEAKKGIKANHGGPFGCVILDENMNFIAASHNQVVKNNDPTAHGEISTIREACKKLGTFDLSNCILITTGEPCPMCQGAIQWARIKKVYYGCSTQDIDDIGFDDKVFFEQKVPKEEVMKKECLALFNEYKNQKKKTHY